MSRQPKTDAKRREFLKTLGLAGTAASAVALAGNAQAAVTTEESGAKEQTQGYRKTEHISHFYQSLRN